MKNSLILVVVVVFTFFGFVASAQNSTSNGQSNASEVVSGPRAQWNTLVVDLGDVNPNSKSDAEFLLTNSGNQPLIITLARASCGCTNLRYPTEPILPGETASVQVSFNGSGRGNVRKTITVQTNASNETTILAFTANVVTEQKASATSQGN